MHVLVLFISWHNQTAIADCSFHSHEWSAFVLFCLSSPLVVRPPVYLSRCEPSGEVRTLYEAPPRLRTHGLSGRVHTLYVPPGVTAGCGG